MLSIPSSKNGTHLSNFGENLAQHLLLYYPVREILRKSLGELMDEKIKKFDRISKHFAVFALSSTFQPSRVHRRRIRVREVNTKINCLQCMNICDFRLPYV